MLHLTRGWGASETVEAAARIGALAEKSGDLQRLIGSLFTRSLQACLAGELSTAAALVDQTLELALREANPSAISLLHMVQLLVRYYRGDLAGAENHFAEGLKFFDDAAFRLNPNGAAIAAFGTASWNACLLGRADVARERLAKMRAVVNPANPHDQPWSDLLGAVLHAIMGEYESAETLAARALDLCERHRFPNDEVHDMFLVMRERSSAAQQKVLP